MRTPLRATQKLDRSVPDLGMAQPPAEAVVISESPLITSVSSFSLNLKSCDRLTEYYFDDAENNNAPVCQHASTVSNYDLSFALITKWTHCFSGTTRLTWHFIFDD